MTKEPRERVMVAVTADLLARARLEDAAARAGWRVETATGENLPARVESLHPSIVVLDLDAGGRQLLERVVEDGAGASVRVIGFFSHVDADLRDAARTAGCEAMPRGRFWRSLPELLA